MARLLIQNGILLDPAQNIADRRDLYIEDGVVRKVAETIAEVPEDTQVIDAAGCWVMPGLIDLHVHFRDPGLTYKECIRTGSMAAAAGGVTTVCTMPNTKPVVDSVEIVEYIKNEAAKAPYTHVLPIAAVTMGQKGKEIVDLEALKAAGICAVSEDGRSVSDARLMKEAMKRCAALDIPIFDHCEEESLAGGCINDGEVSEKLGLPGLSRDAENVMTAREVLLADSTGVRLHICHVSAKESAWILRSAKEHGSRVTAEIGPHHFALSDEDILREPHSKYKMNPPLRTPADVEEMKRALADGTLDAIATDHAPHSAEEKTADLRKSMNGIIGLETSWAVAKKELVDTGILTPSQLVEKMSLNPARILRIPKGTLAEGCCADLCIADPNEEYTVSGPFYSKASNTPFIGWKMKGRIRTTILEGKVIYQDYQMLLKEEEIND